MKNTIIYFDDSALFRRPRFRAVLGVAAFVAAFALVALFVCYPATLAVAFAVGLGMMD